MNNNILLCGDSTIYESHFLSQQALPFVFHRHIRYTEGIGCIPNLHKNVELLYITKGSGSVICGAETMAVRQGDLAVFNSYHVHKAVAAEELAYSCLIIGNDFCAAHDLPLDSLQLAPLIRDPEAGTLFEKLTAEYDSLTDFRNAGIRCAALQLLIYLCCNYSSPKQAGTASDSALESVWAATAYMKQNLGRKLSVDEIAAHAGFSKYYFLRLFKRITGCTVSQYLNLLRCEYASELLRSGSYTVRQTAEKCGFENASYFTNVFQKQTGCLPSTMLKENENG